MELQPQAGWGQRTLFISLTVPRLTLMEMSSLGSCSVVANKYMKALTGLLKHKLPCPRITPRSFEHMWFSWEEPLSPTQLRWLGAYIQQNIVSSRVFSTTIHYSYGKPGQMIKWEPTYSLWPSGDPFLSTQETLNLLRRFEKELFSVLPLPHQRYTFFLISNTSPVSAVTPGILQWDSMLRPFTWGCTRVIGKAICPSRLPPPPNFRYHLQGQGISCASDKLACVTGYPIPFPSLLLAGTISETRKISHLLDYKFII